VAQKIDSISKSIEINRKLVTRRAWILLLNFFFNLEMSSKKRMSLEEKKQVILRIFHQSQDFFQLKDLEKLAVKQGVVEKTVKEVVGSQN
jgi:hypothetical protein